MLILDRIIASVLAAVSALSLSCGAAATERLIYSFTGRADGGHPELPLVQDASGNLYGTSGGDKHGCCAVFRISPTYVFTILHKFVGIEGVYPGQMVVDGHGNIYGVLQAGGASHVGSVYRIDPVGNYSTLHDFSNDLDGARPGRALTVDEKGDLIGTGVVNGTCPGSCGMIYKINQNGLLRIVHSFQDGVGSGMSPNYLIGDGRGGYIFEANENGNSVEEIVSYSKKGNISILHVFDYDLDGFFVGPLTRDGEGNVYGSAYQGATNNFGSVYELSASGDFRVLHAFDGIDGRNPVGAVVRDGGGAIYGATFEGGGNGNIYKITSDGTFENVFYFDRASTGKWPEAGPIIGSDGVLYGTTSLGGSSSDGGIYALTR